MSPASRLPAFQFYPGDWRKDPGIQSLDFAERGIWWELVCFMHESEERGALKVNGRWLDDDQIAKMLGIPKQDWKQSRSRLEAAGVPGIDQETGGLFNRRMVRDEAQRLAKVEAGRKGGKKSRPPVMPPPRKAGPKQDGSSPASEKKANGGFSVSTSASVSKKDGASPDVGDSLKSVYADLIREHWWQGDAPPPEAPDGWVLSRDLNIVGGWERQRYPRDELRGALALYDGEPATLAIAQRNGNRFILNDLIEAFRKRRELEGMRVRAVVPGGIA